MRRIGYLGRAIAAGTLISAEIAIGGEYEVREERAVLEGGIVGIVAQPEGVSDAPAADTMAFVNAAGGSLKEGVIIGCEGHIFEVLTEDQSKAERVQEKTIVRPF